MRKTTWILALSALAWVACDGVEPRENPIDAPEERDGEDDVTQPPGDATTTADASVGDIDAVGDAQDGDVEEPLDEAIARWVDRECNLLDLRYCPLPFPSRHFMAEDASRVTGYSLSFGDRALPRNTSGVHIDGSTYERFDGFGPGTPVVVHLPNVDPSILISENELERSLANDANMVLLEERGDSFEPIPFFAEVDTIGTEADRVTFVRPAVLLKDDTRYVIAMRNLVDREGAPLDPSPTFAMLRDGTTEDTALEDEQAHYDEVFSIVEAAGWSRSEVALAWDWHTASTESLHGPLLSMRDEALEIVGDAGPPLEIIGMTEYTMEENAHIAYEFELEMEVPNFLVEAFVDDIAGYLLNFDQTRTPRLNGTRKANVLVRIPRSAIGGEPAGVLLHGHGLNGTNRQIRGGWEDELANAENFIWVGLDMIGMSTEDFDMLVFIALEMGRFPRLSDRIHQAMFEHVLIYTAMRTTFPQLQAIQDLGVTVDEDSMWYNGISQGGIYGATVMAINTEIDRGHLGVPGNNYSTLLLRSVDFAPFLVILPTAYAQRADLVFTVALAQTHWDTVDPVSHLRHIEAEPHPNTPGTKQVLLAPAKGDYQVSVLTNEIAARSEIGIPLMANYDTEREPALITEAPYPRTGSGVVLWDFGNPWPPAGPVTPPEDELGDPHSKPRRDPKHNEQMMHFYRTGEIIDVCGGDGCTPN